MIINKFLINHDESINTAKQQKPAFLTIMNEI